MLRTGARDQHELSCLFARIDRMRERTHVGRRRRRAELHADRVREPTVKLDVRFVERARAIADPQEVRAAREEAPIAFAHKRLFEREMKAFVRREDLGRDFVESTARTRRRVVSGEQSRRIGRAASFVENGFVDEVAEVARERHAAALFALRCARFGELPSDAADRGDRPRKATRKLGGERRQKRGLRTHVRVLGVRETFCAIAAVDDECFASRSRGESETQRVDLFERDDVRSATQSRKRVFEGHHVAVDGLVASAKPPPCLGRPRERCIEGCGHGGRDGTVSCMNGAPVDQDTSPSAHKRTEPHTDPLVHQVWAERYEIELRQSFDELFVRYRALDQETDSPVRLWLARPELLRTNQERTHAARVLESFVGIGGARLSALLDADREGAFVFAIEPMPEGPTFRALLDQRLALGETFSLAELVPLVADLNAALEAIPESFSHGQVRAEAVHVGTSGAVLTGGFLVHSLAREHLRDALALAPAWRAVTAPETGERLPTAAADRYGAAVIVLEALTGSTRREALSALAVVPDVERELRRLMDTVPDARPTSLGPLLEALASAAGVTPPIVHAGAFRRTHARGPVRPGGRDSERTQENASVTAEHEIEHLDPPPASPNTMPLLTLGEVASVPSRTTPPPPEGSPRAERPKPPPTTKPAAKALHTFDERTKRIRPELLERLVEKSSEPPAAPLVFPSPPPAPRDPSHPMIAVLPSVEVRASIVAPMPMRPLSLPPVQPHALAPEPTAPRTPARPVFQTVSPAPARPRSSANARLIAAAAIAVLIVVTALGLALWKRSANESARRERELRESVLELRAR